MRGISKYFNIVFLLLILICCSFSLAAPNPLYKLLSSGNTVQDKNFYLLTLFESLPDVRKMLNEDKKLHAISQARRKKLIEADEVCDDNIGCYVRAEWLDSEDVKAVYLRLGELATTPAFKSLIYNHMLSSGVFSRYENINDGAFLQQAWLDAAKGMNRIMRIYALGEPPQYSKIDSLSVNLKSKGHKFSVRSIVGAYVDAKEHALFFSSALKFSLDLLYLNNRQSAEMFEPLESGENRVAKEAIRSVKWGDFPYSAILVLGDGPDAPGIALGALGKMRLRLAAKRYKNGLAPLVILSGGNVHPIHTPYNEALEMKRELMSRYAVPENAIIIEPHARHTTTNFRNAARLMFHYGIPMNKQAIVTTSRHHSAYVESKKFAERCIKELGYMPHILQDRLNKFDMIFIPQVLSLHRNAMDPLDP